MLNAGLIPLTVIDRHKALLSFASDNAGRARISRLRVETKKRGFDPNIWFGNVEYLAAEKIGAETVTDVSNIDKYDIAYRLIVDEMTRKPKATADARRQVIPLKAEGVAAAQ